MAAKTKNNNYWYRATYITPIGHLQEASGGIFALGDIDALDTINELLGASGDVQGVMVYELLEGGEVGELVASTHVGDRKPRELTADDDTYYRKTVLTLPAPKTDAEGFEDKTLFDVFNPVYKRVASDTKLGGVEK